MMLNRERWNFLHTTVDRTLTVGADDRAAAHAVLDILEVAFHDLHAIAVSQHTRANFTSGPAAILKEGDAL